jgi:hypothetical protein
MLQKVVVELPLFQSLFDLNEGFYGGGYNIYRILSLMDRNVSVI